MIQPSVTMKGMTTVGEAKVNIGADVGDDDSLT